MFSEEIEKDYIIMQAATSEGTQIKYRKDGYWYKLDNRGREGLAEYLASEILKYTSMDASEYVLYEQGMVNGHPGCRSKKRKEGDSAPIFWLSQKNGRIFWQRIYP